MTQKERGSCCTPESYEVGGNVVGRSDESVIDDMGDRDDESAGEGDRQEDSDHGTASMRDRSVEKPSEIP
jgi:hypothetical protein